MNKYMNYKPDRVMVHIRARTLGVIKENKKLGETENENKIVDSFLSFNDFKMIFIQRARECSDKIKSKM